MVTTNATKEMEMNQEHGTGVAPSKNGHYRTSDLYYAAYLKVAGVTLMGTKREAGRVFFLFEEGDGQTLRDLKQEYYNRSSKVAALTYADEIKVMKALTHEGGGE
jgi:hypothetical protein